MHILSGSNSTVGSFLLSNYGNTSLVNHALELPTIHSNPGANATRHLLPKDGTHSSWHDRQGAQLLQGASQLCSTVPGTECYFETVHMLVLVCALAMTILVILCCFAFFRDDKEEQITPLCPQLVVKDKELSFKMPFGANMDRMIVTDDVNQVVCKVSLEWPDPFHPGASGVAATARILNNLDLTLATVVARNVAVVGQGLALCRAGCEIFGFVEPDGPFRYHVRHRTGVHLLTLVGDFETMDVQGINPVGSKVCSFGVAKNECQGRVLQHVDAGLVISSFMAMHVHRRLTVTIPAQRQTNKRAGQH